MLGESLALAAAATWAVSVILFKQSEDVTPQGLWAPWRNMAVGPVGPWGPVGPVAP